jgi:DNA-binding PadR family transcriptional regulator
MRIAQTGYAILGLLAIEPNQSGYEIRRTVRDSVGFFWGESYGQIYPTLKRLSADGLIAPTEVEGAGKKRTQRYSLTAAGYAELQQWLATPYREDPPRDEFLLKLFFGREAAPEISIAHINQYQERIRGLLAVLEDLERLGRLHGSGQPGMPFWMLTLSYGMGQLRAGLEWSESAMAVLTSQEAAQACSQPPAPFAPQG